MKNFKPSFYSTVSASLHLKGIFKGQVLQHVEGEGRFGPCLLLSHPLEVASMGCAALHSAQNSMKGEWGQGVCIRGKGQENSPGGLQNSEPKLKNPRWIGQLGFGPLKSVHQCLVQYVPLSFYSTCTFVLPGISFAWNNHSKVQTHTRDPQGLIIFRNNIA